MEIEINSKKYKLIQNLGYCKNCQTINESTHDWIIIECPCSSCFVSGGISCRARVYGVHAINISKWLDVDSGLIINYNQLYIVQPEKLEKPEKPEQSKKECISIN